MNIRVIAEIGINHRGKAKVAKQLINGAASAGAWAVKFQFRNPDTFYAKTDEIGDEIISQEINRIQISPASYCQLVDYAHQQGLQVGISFFRVEDVEYFGPNLSDFDFFKIPSAELLNYQLYAALKKFNKPILLSTGGHTEESIEARLKTLVGDNAIILHCIANYPLLIGNQNLKFMHRLAEMTDLPIGYSSHDQDWEACVVAATLNAEYIERHITLDKQGGGLDDSTSSDLAEFHQLCKLIKHVPAILGDGARSINQGEVINMQNLGTSLYCSRDIVVGDIPTIEDFSLKAPRKGITEGEFLDYASLPLTKPIFNNQPLTPGHFASEVICLTQEQIEFCNDHEISIPIRLHDAQVLFDRLPVDNYEFHFSYGEIDQVSRDLDGFLKLCSKDKQYSIHLPDYLHGNRLIDPLSSDLSTRSDSRELIQKSADIVAALTNLTGHKTPAVASFSRLVDNNKQTTLEAIFDFVCETETSYFKLLPQWLPKIAWYFGGAETLHLFCDFEDIEYIEKYKTAICLDVAHLILSANYVGADWPEWYQRLSLYAEHLHVSDATGIDGEGVEFGKGELHDVDTIFSHTSRKVLEVWQGHLDSGDGFVKAIHYLAGAK